MTIPARIAAWDLRARVGETSAVFYGFTNRTRTDLSLKQRTM